MRATPASGKNAGAVDAAGIPSGVAGASRWGSLSDHGGLVTEVSTLRLGVRQFRDGFMLRGCRLRCGTRILSRRPDSVCAHSGLGMHVCNEHTIPSPEQRCCRLSTWQARESAGRTFDSVTESFALRPSQADFLPRCRRTQCGQEGETRHCSRYRARMQRRAAYPAIAFTPFCGAIPARSGVIDEGVILPARIWYRPIRIVGGGGSE